MKLLGKDRAFIESFQSAKKRAAQPVADFLRASPFSGTDEIQHILNHPEYFVLGVNMHEGTIAAAWIKDEGVYCAPTRRRLDEIEAWGESAEAWQIREFFLDKELQLVDSPDDIAGFGIGFAEWRSSLLATAKIYATNQRPKFTAWIKKAIKQRESWRTNLRAIDGVTPSIEEMNITIDSEVLFLTKLI